MTDLFQDKILRAFKVGVTSGQKLKGESSPQTLSEGKKRENQSSSYTRFIPLKGYVFLMRPK